MAQSPLRILIVDDEQALSEAIAYRLRAANYDVVTATSARDGMELALEAPGFQLILLDRRLPQGDGLALLAELRANERSSAIPVIVMSGCESDKPLALQKGAAGFLSKPFRSAPLIELVDRLTRESALMRV